jgi:hypothetical protein
VVLVVKVVVIHYWERKRAMVVRVDTQVRVVKVAIVIIFQMLRLVLEAVVVGVMLLEPLEEGLVYMVKEHRVRQEIRVLLVVEVLGNFMAVGVALLVAAQSVLFGVRAVPVVPHHSHQLTWERK